jgi:hypothetical protein
LVRPGSSLYFEIGYYEEVVDMPYWDYKAVGNFIYSGIKIYCGSKAFVPHHGDWLDTTSGYMLVVDDQPGIPGTDLCRGLVGQTVLGKFQIQNPKGSWLNLNIAIIIMCDPALKRKRETDVVRSDSNELEAATFAMVKRKGMLKRNQAMGTWTTSSGAQHTGLSHVWSVTLLHELFHFVLDSQSNYRPLLPCHRVGLTDGNGSVHYI